MMERKKHRATETSARERRRDRAVQQMNPALHAEYLRLGDAIARSDWSDAHAKYEIGEIAARVADASTYGGGAVKLLARALGYEKDVLYDAARVATCWSKSAFDDVLARPTPYRRPLSFRHFVVLTREPDAKKRNALLELALRDGLSSHALEKLVLEGTPNRVERQPSRIAKALIAHQRAARKWLHELDETALASPETRALLESVCDEARKLIADAEAKMRSRSAGTGGRDAKLPERKPEKQIFGSIRKSAAGLFGMPLRSQDADD